MSHLTHFLILLSINYCVIVSVDVLCRKFVSKDEISCRIISLYPRGFHMKLKLIEVIKEYPYFSFERISRLLNNEMIYFFAKRGQQIKSYFNRLLHGSLKWVAYFIVYIINQRFQKNCQVYLIFI